MLASIGRPSAGPAVVRTDAQSAIDALHGPVIAQRLCHIDIRMHRTRQAIDDGDITIRYVHTSENRADLFTKALPSPVIRRHICAARSLSSLR